MLLYLNYLRTPKYYHINCFGGSRGSDWWSSNAYILSDVPEGTSNAYILVVDNVV